MSITPLTELPDRVLLRPGVHAVRRGDGQLQLGLDAPARVVVPDTRQMRAAIRALAEGARVPRGGPTARLVRDLETAGLLHHLGDEDSRALESVRIAASDVDVTDLERALTGAGLEIRRESRRGPTREADVVLLLSAGPLPRSAGDPSLAAGVPHLAMAGTGAPGALRVGPFVVPGITACLHCVDAHESLHDPRRPLVLDQLADRDPEPRDPVDVALGMALVARDVVHLAEGRRPATWSTSLDLGPGLTVRSWERHPHCGCAWNRL